MISLRESRSSGVKLNRIELRKINYVDHKTRIVRNWVQYTERIYRDLRLEGKSVIVLGPRIRKEAAS